MKCNFKGHANINILSLGAWSISLHKAIHFLLKSGPKSQSATMLFARKKISKSEVEPSRFWLDVFYILNNVISMGNLTR